MIRGNKGGAVLTSRTGPVRHDRVLNLGPLSLVGTESLRNEKLSFPMHPDLCDDNIEYVIETVREFY